MWRPLWHAPASAAPATHERRSGSPPLAPRPTADGDNGLADGDAPSVVGISGSLRPNSRTSAAVRAVLAGAADAGAMTELVDLADLPPLPFFDSGIRRDDQPQPVAMLLENVRRARGLVLGSPVYHDNMSGALKNALDLLQLLAWDTPPWLTGKVVALVAVAGGRPASGVHALDGMQHACRALRAWTLPAATVVPGVLGPHEQPSELRETFDRLRSMGCQLACGATLVARVRTERDAAGHA
jgi:FMN reductase